MDLGMTFLPLEVPYVPPAPAPPLAPSPPRLANAVPSLTTPIPTITSLNKILLETTHDPALKIAWCKDVCFLVDRQQPGSVTEIRTGPVRILDPQLLRLSQIAVLADIIPCKNASADTALPSRGYLLASRLPRIWCLSGSGEAQSENGV